MSRGVEASGATVHGYECRSSGTYRALGFRVCRALGFRGVGLRAYRGLPGVATTCG